MRPIAVVPATVCNVCGASLSGRRTDARVCSPTCRRDLARIRHLAAGEPIPGYQTLGAFLARHKRAKQGETTC